ncbi:MAG: FHA domain-containing protein [Candidatus Thiodiazotropha sp. (ex Ctena orbiculata)]|nr:FHA domain-containing protein [Candidatus Thiodiazotropha taylori]MBT2996119.1 FHA domain-containing protein [Candidatus Thiodiazotropha taylori]MBT2999737.1 FHA domain-containing protein [Candidatus Thiodiazotropha taylori]MBV2106380.1 FHA domain-containing protein [Candidatus Thiodiazotropha taylori]MBV2110512.1 FHA domain-containing protein [Candidatus Thiodiazotropha taylori]
MEKLVVMGGDESPQEFPLVDKRMVIGRDETCDICLKDRSVSRHHATMQRVFNGYSIEDEQSTNGTRVNGNLVTKRFLKHGDLIEVGKYHLRFIAEQAPQEMDDPDRTVVLRPRDRELPQDPVSELSPTPPSAGTTTLQEEAIVPLQSSEPTVETSTDTPAAHQPRVRFLSGENVGEEKVIDRAFFSVGNPGGDLVLINQRQTGFFLLKVGGEHPPLINGEPTKAGGVELQNGDRIDLGELSLEFVN